MAREIPLRECDGTEENMRLKVRASARDGRARAVLLPPNFRTMGPVPFTATEFASLDAWLAEDGWPDERMDVATLEGYLVALLVWPIELPAGAWLPSIWGVRGWKVAAKIDTTEMYDRFIALITGLIQELERRLAISPRRRTFVLAHDAKTISSPYFAGSAWSTGFMTSLYQNAAGLQSRSISSRSAVESIASYASLRSQQPNAMPAAASALSTAIAILVEERASRGPLGPLPVSGAPIGRRAPSPLPRVA
jgi:yecA family protein